MILKDYLAISGQHGLFKFIAQGRNAMIVEHLETRKRTTAFGSSKVISLEDISIFTTGEEIPLSKVFDRIYDRENGGPAPDEKSDIKVLRTYFEEILPEYDRERVYESDIRKVFRWYNILQKLNLLVKEEPEKTEEKEEVKEEVVEGKMESKDSSEKTSSTKKLKSAAKSTEKTEEESAVKPARSGSGKKKKTTEE